MPRGAGPADKNVNSVEKIRGNEEEWLGKPCILKHFNCLFGQLKPVTQGILQKKLWISSEGGCCKGMRYKNKLTHLYDTVYHFSFINCVHECKRLAWAWEHGAWYWLGTVTVSPFKSKVKGSNAILSSQFCSLYWIQNTVVTSCFHNYLWLSIHSCIFSISTLNLDCKYQNETFFFFLHHRTEHRSF